LPKRKRKPYCGDGRFAAYPKKLAFAQQPSTKVTPNALSKLPRVQIQPEDNKRVPFGGNAWEFTYQEQEEDAVMMQGKKN